MNAGYLNKDWLGGNPLDKRREDFCSLHDIKTLEWIEVFLEMLKGQQSVCLDIACVDSIHVSAAMYNWCMKQNFENIFEIGCPTLHRIPTSGTVKEIGLQHVLRDGSWTSTEVSSFCVIESKVRKIDLSNNAIGHSYTCNFFINHVDLYIEDSDLEILDISGNGIEFENFNLFKSFKRYYL